MKRTIVIIISLLFISCNNSKKLEGHWHINKLDTETGELKEPYLVMDVGEDTVASIATSSIYGTYEGVHLRKKKQLNFPGQCGSFHFDYRVRNSQIYLNNHLGEKYQGQKCEEHCCDKLEHLTKDIKVDIEFMQIANEREELKPREISFNYTNSENIFVGRPKEEYKEEFGDSIRLQLSHEIASIKDIQEWLENRKERHHSQDLNFSKIKIIADKNVDFEDIESIACEVSSLGFTQIYLGFLKPDYLIETDYIEYVFFDRIRLDPRMSLERIVK